MLVPTDLGPAAPEHDEFAVAVADALKRGEPLHNEGVATRGLRLWYVRTRRLRRVEVDDGRLECSLGDDFTLSDEDPDEPADHCERPCQIHDTWFWRVGDDEAARTHVVELSREHQREWCEGCHGTHASVWSTTTPKVATPPQRS